LKGHQENQTQRLQSIRRCSANAIGTHGTGFWYWSLNLENPGAGPGLSR